MHINGSYFSFLNYYALDKVLYNIACLKLVAISCGRGSHFPLPLHNLKDEEK